MGASPTIPAHGAACSPPTPARHCQQQGPFPATHSACTLLLTGEEEAGLSNPSSPSITAGTAGYHRRRSHWGQGLPDHRKPPETSSKGAGSEQSLQAHSLAPHFFSSLSNGKKKKKKAPVSDSAVPSYPEFLNQWLLRVPLRGFWVCGRRGEGRGLFNPCVTHILQKLKRAFSRRFFPATQVLQRGCPVAPGLRFFPQGLSPEPSQAPAAPAQPTCRMQPRQRVQPRTWGPRDLQVQWGAQGW